jgi:pSer/pThr/pTyr-binding forkhead associated (FHA) protein
MGTLVIRRRGKIVAELNLRLGEVKIGRKTGDIVLDDPAVSSEHAVIRTVASSSTIYDLNSTNGTYVEKKRIQKHDLQDGETIIIGEHSLQYRDELGVGKPSKIVTAEPRADDNSTMMIQFARLIATEGADKGKRVSLSKEVITLENAGKHPVQIMRTSRGYLLDTEEGAGEAKINGHAVDGAQMLENGDIIEVGPTKYQFYSA